MTQFPPSSDPSLWLFFLFEILLLDLTIICLLFNMKCLTSNMSSLRGLSWSLWQKHPLPLTFYLVFLVFWQHFFFYHCLKCFIYLLTCFLSVASTKLWFLGRDSSCFVQGWIPIAQNKYLLTISAKTHQIHWERKAEWWFPSRVWGQVGGECGVSLMATEFQFCNMKKVQEMNGDDGCAMMWIY